MALHALLLSLLTVYPNYHGRYRYGLFGLRAEKQPSNQRDLFILVNFFLVTILSWLGSFFYCLDNKNPLSQYPVSYHCSTWLCFLFSLILGCILHAGNRWVASGKCWQHSLPVIHSMQQPLRLLKVEFFLFAKVMYKWNCKSFKLRYWENCKQFCQFFLLISFLKFMIFTKIKVDVCLSARDQSWWVYTKLCSG